MASLITGPGEDDAIDVGSAGFVRRAAQEIENVVFGDPNFADSFADDPNLALSALSNLAIDEDDLPPEYIQAVRDEAAAVLKHYRDQLSPPTVDLLEKLSCAGKE